MSKLKLNVIFIILLFIAIVISLYGFVLTAASAIPFQDPQYAPSSALERQKIESIIGLVMLVVGTLMFWGDIIWRIIMGKRINRRLESK